MDKHEQGLLEFFGDVENVKKFKKLKNTEQMIEFMWKTPALQTFLRESSEQISGKSEGDTRRFREMGNKLFKVGKDREAIKMFNKAIIKAPVNEAGVGRDLSLAIANRSAALLKLGFLKLALQDIEFALVSGYPKDLRYKLLERRIKIYVTIHDKDSAFDTRGDFIIALKNSTIEEDKKCKLENEIQALLESLEFPKIAPNQDEITEENVSKQELGKSHSFLPSLSVDVDIEFDPARGRFGVANTDIPAGTVILVEPALVTVNKEDHIDRYCDFCHQKIELLLIPCKTCAHVAYCSNKCKEHALDMYHKSECGSAELFGKVLDNIKKDGKTKTGSTKDISKLCFRAIAQKPLSWYKENKSCINDRFPMFGDEAYQLTPQHSMFSLVTHQDRIQSGRLWSFLISAVCHIKALQITGYFGAKKFKTPPTLTEDELYIGGLLVQVFELMQFNTHAITESTDREHLDDIDVKKDFENKTRVIGDGLYPTYSLVNHSCDGNTYKYFDGSTIVVVASKNICEGEEVTNNYFPHVQLIPRPQRRAWLGQHYWFDCQCEACVNDQPSLADISTHYTNFCCQKENCMGVVKENSKCPGCGEAIDVDINKVEIEKIKQTLESLRTKMSSAKDVKSNEEIYNKTLQTWIRLQKLVRHPYKLLYTTEQLSKHG